MTLQMTLLIPLLAQLALPVHGGGDLVQLQGDGGVPHRLAGTHNLPLLLTPHSPTPASVIIYGETIYFSNRPKQNKKR